MNSDIVAQLMIPVISGLCTLVFFVFWWFDVNRSFSRALALAFGACFCGQFITFFLVEVSPTLSHKMYSTVGYAISVPLIAWATYNRAGLKIPLLLMMFVALTGLPLTFWASANFEVLNTRILLSNTTIGAMLCIAALGLRSTIKKSVPDASAVACLMAIGTYFIVFPHITLAIDGEITAANFQTSTHKHVLTLSKGICVLLLAASLTSLGVTDLVKQVKQQSEIDHLTGLKNRAAFENEVQLSFDSSGSSPELTLILIDVDNFKTINDEFGHPTGDAVIRAFGGVVKRATRASDIAGRVGGEELCVMLRDTDAEMGREIAERLRVCFSALAIPGLPMGRYVTASFGVATLEENEDYSSLYRRADEILYQAKRAGRDRVLTDKDMSQNRIDEARSRIRIASADKGKKTHRSCMISAFCTNMC